MNQGSAPLLFYGRRLLVYVEDLDRAVNYYRDIHGFKPLGGVAGTNFEFATRAPRWCFTATDGLPSHRGTESASCRAFRFRRGFTT